MSDPKPETQQPEFVVKAPDHKTLYVDGFSIRPTVADVQITFNTATRIALPNNQGGVQMVDAMMEQLTAAMTLHTVKSLVVNLTRILELIESETGSIRVTERSLPNEAMLEQVKTSLGRNRLVELRTPKFPA